MFLKKICDQSHLFKKANSYRKQCMALMMCVLMTLLMTGCQTSSGSDVQMSENVAQDENRKPVIICTLFPQYDFARQIYGDEADVRMLLAPGQESHMYDPTPQDMIEISHADMFIYTGDEMEPWAAQIVESLDGVKVLDLSKYVKLQAEEEHDEDEEHSDADHEGEDEHDHEEAHAHHHHHEHSYDPHYWLNLENAAKMAAAIADASKELQVSDPEALQKRAEDYEAQLLAMDERYKTMIEESSRNDIVFAGRFAYGYLISHYGLSYETVYQSCSAEADPSIYDMTHVIDYIKAHQVHTIFYEELSSGRVAQTIAQDTGVDIRVLSTAHNVSKEEFDAGVTFLDIMQQNYDVLKEALN